MPAYTFLSKMQLGVRLEYAVRFRHPIRCGGGVLEAWQWKYALFWASYGNSHNLYAFRHRGCRLGSLSRSLVFIIAIRGKFWNCNSVYKSSWCHYGYAISIGSAIHQDKPSGPV